MMTVILVRKVHIGFGPHCDGRSSVGQRADAG